MVSACGAIVTATGEVMSVDLGSSSGTIAGGQVKCEHCHVIGSRSRSSHVVQVKRMIESTGNEGGRRTFGHRSW